MMALTAMQYTQITTADCTNNASRRQLRYVIFTARRMCDVCYAKVSVSSSAYCIETVERICLYLSPYDGLQGHYFSVSKDLSGNSTGSSLWGRQIHVRFENSWYSYNLDRCITSMDRQRGILASNWQESPITCEHAMNWTERALRLQP